MPDRRPNAGSESLIVPGISASGLLRAKCARDRPIWGWPHGVRNVPDPGFPRVLEGGLSRQDMDPGSVSPNSSLPDEPAGPQPPSRHTCECVCSRRDGAIVGLWACLVNGGLWHAGEWLSWRRPGECLSCRLNRRRLDLPSSSKDSRRFHSANP